MIGLKITPGPNTRNERIEIDEWATVENHIGGTYREACLLHHPKDDVDVLLYFDPESAGEINPVATALAMVLGIDTPFTISLQRPIRGPAVVIPRAEDGPAVSDIFTAVLDALTHGQRLFHQQHKDKP